MGAQISVLGLILSSYPYLRSAMVRFPLILLLPWQKGNLAYADLSNGEKTVSVLAHDFSCHKGLTWDIYSQYPP